MALFSDVPCSPETTEWRQAAVNFLEQSRLCFSSSSETTQTTFVRIKKLQNLLLKDCVFSSAQFLWFLTKHGFIKHFQLTALAPCHRVTETHSGTLWVSCSLSLLLDCLLHRTHELYMRYWRQWDSRRKKRKENLIWSDWHSNCKQCAAQHATSMLQHAATLLRSTQ